MDIIQSNCARRTIFHRGREHCARMYTRGERACARLEKGRDAAARNYRCCPAIRERDRSSLARFPRNFLPLFSTSLRSLSPISVFPSDFGHSHLYSRHTYHFSPFVFLLFTSRPAVHPLTSQLAPSFTLFSRPSGVNISPQRRTAAGVGKINSLTRRRISGVFPNEVRARAGEHLGTSSSAPPPSPTSRPARYQRAHLRLLSLADSLSCLARATCV